MSDRDELVVRSVLDDAARRATLPAGSTQRKLGDVLRHVHGLDGARAGGGHAGRADARRDRRIRSRRGSSAQIGELQTRG